MVTTHELERLLVIAEAADEIAPGPWFHCPTHGQLCHLNEAGGVTYLSTERRVPLQPTDAFMLAFDPTTALRLLTALARAEENASARERVLTRRLDALRKCERERDALQRRAGDDRR